MITAISKPCGLLLAHLLGLHEINYTRDDKGQKSGKADDARQVNDEVSRIVILMSEIIVK